VSLFWRRGCFNEIIFPQIISRVILSKAACLHRHGKFRFEESRRVWSDELNLPSTIAEDREIVANNLSWNAPISNKEPFYVTERNYRYYLARYFQMKIEGLSNMITRRASLARITQADALRFSLTCAGTCRRTLSCSWDEFSTQTTRMRVNWIETALDTGSEVKLLRNKNA